MLLVAPNDRAIQQWLNHELTLVEERFAAEMISDLPCVNSLVAHVERYRGKMLRPMLVLLSGLATAPPGADLVSDHRILAAVVETVHMATLVHDDILDEAEVRRRGATINHLRGNEAAVMLGDYLLSHAYRLCSLLEDSRPNLVIAQTTNLVCEGELLQLANRGNWALDEQTYFEIIRRKTASLCGACCRVGGMLHHASSEAADALYDFGEKLGMAFQIIDDLLDLSGEQATVGKSLGLDLEKGKLTLPLIHYLRVAGELERQAFRDRLETGQRAGGLGQDQAREVLALVSRSGSLLYSRQQAHRLIGLAQSSLWRVPTSEARTLLMEVADAVLSRQA